MTEVIEAPLTTAIDDAVFATERQARDRGRADTDALQDVAGELAEALGFLVAHYSAGLRQLEAALHNVNGAVEAAAKDLHAQLGRSMGAPK